MLASERKLKISSLLRIYSKKHGDISVKSYRSEFESAEVSKRWDQEVSTFADDTAVLAPAFTSGADGNTLGVFDIHCRLHSKTGSKKDPV